MVAVTYKLQDFTGLSDGYCILGIENVRKEG